MSEDSHSPLPRRNSRPTARRPIPGYIAIAVVVMWAQIVIGVIVLGLLARWILTTPESDTEHYVMLLGGALIAVTYGMLAYRIWHGDALSRKITIALTGAVLMFACVQSLGGLMYTIDLVVLSSAGVVMGLLLFPDSARYCEKRR